MTRCVGYIEAVYHSVWVCTPCAPGPANNLAASRVLPRRRNHRRIRTRHPIESEKEMNVQEAQKLLQAEHARTGALLDAATEVSQVTVKRDEVKRLGAAKDRLDRDVKQLQSDMASLNASKGVVTRDLKKRVKDADDEFARSLDTRRAARDNESARDDAAFEVRKVLHEERMAEFDERERIASGLAKSAEDGLERMRKKLAA